jgi:hypothetical protein
LLKLYRRDEHGTLLYHEAWRAGGRVVEHWGRVGEPGDRRFHELDDDLDERTVIARLLGPFQAAGGREIPLDDHEPLAVVFAAVEGQGEAERAKLQALEDRLDELLGWHGLGHCDGHAADGPELIVECFVVDADAGRRVIAADLAGTEFADFIAIR